MDFQNEKALILSYFNAIEGATSEQIMDKISPYIAPDCRWRGYHPFHEQTGVENICRQFWEPFLYAMNTVQRRQDIFFAGLNEIDNFDSVWVVSMGHLLGLFDRPFLNIQPTGKMAFFRYCEFNRVKNGKITETAFFFDLPHLMIQAGLSPFVSQRGAQLVHPGPITHSGLCFDACDLKAGRQTLLAINAMINDLGQWQSGLPLEEELARTWHQDMIWWGPAGIGSTYTIKRYAKQHSAPFRAAFTDRSATRHICRLAEGHFGGFFGWPNFTARLQQEFLGIKPSDILAEFRVIDIYRRHKNKLAENWVFIDIPHWMKQNGYDLLQKTHD